MQFLKAFHFGYLSFNKDSLKLYAGVNLADFVNLIRHEDHAYLGAAGKYVTIDKMGGGRFAFSASPSPFGLHFFDDGKIALKTADKFLSARPDGNITLVDRPQIWEGFDIDNLSDALSFSRNLVLYCTNNKISKLACCCSNLKYGKGDWFQTDLHANAKENLYPLDIAKKFKIPNSTFDYIFIEHGLEHVDFDGVVNFCRESHRVLKPNGILRIASPSLDNWIKYYIIDDDFNDKITECVMKNCCKSAYDMGVSSKALAINNVMRNWSHKCVLDYKTYKDILLKSGFMSITQEKIHHSTYDELNNIETRSDSYTEFETLVLEARK